MIKTVDCGPRVASGHSLRDPNSNDLCARVQYVCGVAAAGNEPVDPYATTLAIVRVWVSGPRKGEQEYLRSNCVARTATPRVTPLLAKQEIEKRVPSPSVGVAPPGGETLVNIQTVLWADTPADRDLGTVTLLGIYRVALRVHVDHVAWYFGDGDADRTTTPGKPYRTGEHCDTVTCPGHYGHVYATTGDMTVSAQVSWTGQYSVNGGAWQDIPGAVTGPEQSAQVTVIEARGVLVPDPTPS